MPRRSRLVIPNLAHHVTQRGSRRGPVFFNQKDRLIYLSLLRRYAEQNGVEVLAYCLMSNHIHLILVPETATALSSTLKNTHMRYATIINGENDWTGHLWQQRFFSAPLDEDYLWTAIRYVERNPVAAGIVSHPCDYRWSSAIAHTHKKRDSILTLDPRWNSIINSKQNWAEWLEEPEPVTRVELLRERTRRELPCGSDGFVKDLETQFGRKLTLGSRGRPREK